MRFKSTFIFLSMMASAAHAESELISLDYRGTGCPSGSLFWEQDTVRNEITLYYSRFEVNAMSGRSDMADCQVYANLYPPRGYEIGVQAVDMSGYADVSDAGSDVSVSIWQEMSRQRPTRITDRRQAG